MPGHDAHFGLEGREAKRAPVPGPGAIGDTEFNAFEAEPGL